MLPDGVRRPLILLNALHSTGGGGLSYVCGILPFLARDARAQWRVVLPAAVREKVLIPSGMEVRWVGRLPFGLLHAYEQLWLPVVARLSGVRAMWCNANYVPLGAPKAVPTVHTTLTAGAYAERPIMRIYWKVLRWLTVASLRRAPAVLAVAKHVVAEMGQNEAVLGKVVVAPVGIPAGRDEVLSLESREDFVLAVGDYYPQKNYELLVRAFALLKAQKPGIRLIIVGRRVEEAVGRQVDGLVAEWGLEKDVEQRGGLPHDEVMALMGKAKVFVNTSLAEAVGMPILEAMACGTPVVAPKLPFVEELAGDAVLQVAVGDGDVASAFAVALYAMCENPAVARIFRLRGFVRAGDFTWERTARIVADVMVDVAGR